MTYLSFLPIGRPASGRLVYRPIYPQDVSDSATRDGWRPRARRDPEDDELLSIIAAVLPLLNRRH